MEGEDYLLTCAEVGVALAGFAALVVVLRQGEGRFDSSMVRVVVRNLIERGLVATFLSFLPILLTGLGVSDPMVWTLSSGGFVTYAATMVWRGFGARRAGGLGQLGVTTLWFSVTMVIGLGVMGLQAFHALGIGLTQGVWWYALAVTWLLASAGYLFVFVVTSWVREA